MAIKVIIFDFDGTIADVYDTVKEIWNRLSDEYGYESLKNFEKYRDMEKSEALRQLDVPKFKIPFLVRRAKSELNKEMENQKPFPNIRKVLMKLKQKGFRAAIITSESRENVNLFLKKNKLDMFDFIYTTTSIFGKHRVIKKFLKDRDFKEDEVIYVGDEIRDIEACRKARIKIIAVSWGFNSRRILEKKDPDFLVDEPKELLDLIKI